jgi:hypothetical protein
MKRARWLVASVALLGAGVVSAGDMSGFSIEPFVGYAHLRIDQNSTLEGETKRVDQGLVGVSLAYKAPFGLVVNAGYSDAIHDDIFVFDIASGYELEQYYGTVGYQFDFGRGWSFTPKAGRSRLRLTSEDSLLVDQFGEQQKRLIGYQNFFEASLMKNISRSISMGLTLRDVDADFGDWRSAAFTVNFAF